MKNTNFMHIKNCFNNKYLSGYWLFKWLLAMDGGDWIFDWVDVIDVVNCEPCCTIVDECLLVTVASDSAKLGTRGLVCFNNRGECVISITLLLSSATLKFLSLLY